MKLRLAAFAWLLMAPLAQSESTSSQVSISIEPKSGVAAGRLREAARTAAVRSGDAFDGLLPVVSDALAEELEARLARDAGEDFEEEVTLRTRDHKVAVIFYR